MNTILKKDGLAAKSNHYNIGQIQPIDLIASQKLDFLQGSAVKYICRYKYKGTPIQDLEKAKQYIDWMIQLEQAKGGVTCKSR